MKLQQTDLTKFLTKKCLMKCNRIKKEPQGTTLFMVPFLMHFPSFAWFPEQILILTHFYH